MGFFDSRRERKRFLKDTRKEYEKYERKKAQREAFVEFIEDLDKIKGEHKVSVILKVKSKYQKEIYDFLKKNIIDDYSSQVGKYNILVDNKPTNFKIMHKSLSHGKFITEIKLNKIQNKIRLVCSIKGSYMGIANLEPDNIKEFEEFFNEQVEQINELFGK